VKGFIPNRAFAQELSEQDEHREGLKQVAESVKGPAEQFARAAGAPWMPRAGHELIEVGEDAEGVYVANTDHGGHLTEYGSAKSPPHAPLRRGARAAGLRLDE
jgi:hypothetical protein